MFINVMFSCLTRLPVVPEVNTCDLAATVNTGCSHLVQIRLKVLRLTEAFLYLAHILFLFPKMHLLPSNVVLFCSFEHAYYAGSTLSAEQP